MGLFDRFKNHGSTQAKPAKPEPVEVVASEDMVAAPATGTVIAMPDLPDPVFSGGAMGLAAGIQPEVGIVYAPITGQVIAAMPHAIGIEGDGTAEVLVHVGVDTVEMNGEGFTLHVAKGDQVQAGQPLVSFDRAKVAAAGHPDVVICVVTNTEDIEDAGGSVVTAIESGSMIQAGQALLQTK